MNRATAVVLALMIAFTPGCTNEQKAMWCRAATTIDVVKTAVGFAFPFLAPHLAQQYAVLSAAVDAAKAPLLAACAKGETDGPAIDKAAAAAINLLKWWQEHRAEVAASRPPGVEPLDQRGLRAPDDSTQVLQELEAFQAERARGTE